MYLNRHKQAKGVLYVDDGETFNNQHKQEYNFIEFDFNDYQLNVNVKHFKYTKIATVIDLVQIRGFEGEVPEIEIK